MTINSSKANEMGFGTFDEGISISRYDEWEYLSGKEITNNRVWTSTLDSSGNIWYGTSGGLDIVRNGQSVKSHSKESGLDYSKVTAVKYDEDLNCVWAGTSRGINLAYEDSIVHLKDFKGNRVRAIEKRGNIIYLGTRQGVWKLSLIHI